MRRLPIFFLIDISESMVGEQIQAVEDGMATIIKVIKTDPYAIETVWISIIVFAGQAKTLVPLQEIVSFYPPKFPIGGGTSLSSGLSHLMLELRKNIVKTTMEQKGDWKPIIFLFTDGVPTDDTKPAISEWKKNWQSSANMVAVSFGDEPDSNILKDLTENVLHFKNSSEEDYKKFFKWVTDSIKTSSISVESNQSGFELASIDGVTISKLNLTKSSPPKQYSDSNFVVLAAKCQNTKKPYLLKYKKTVNPAGFTDLNRKTLSYRLVAGYKVDSAYFELSDKNGNYSKVNTEVLEGGTSCPHCNNKYALALCQCQQIHCVGVEKVSTCPWCGTQGSYGEANFDVNKTQG
ncbi:TerY-C metal binding domain-containing protein [Dyadobacter sp. 50-39]|uniref:TerY-C metal binding domain-containing protein n=1 Tax=Dyadobacter sp. 50-39 TaxID=1895756 RepID=UPI0009628FEB|nr:TerY-C metal binding domain-containing protein [Dyadobacter sp. 50-39]OJV22441.1 MAG: VWA domain-containing protein [Dyadobacter sp. 50-39]